MSQPFTTTGARISIIENTSEDDGEIPHYNEVYNDSISYAKYDDHESWTNAIDILLEKAPSQLLSSTKSLCVSGTSASCLIVDSQTGKVTRKSKMYDYDITHAREGNDYVDPIAHIKTQEIIDQFVPEQHVTRGSTSALSKLLHYNFCETFTNTEVLAHQSEYVASTLFLSDPIKCGAGDVRNKREYISDWHNALKLGYDVRKLCYPSWLVDCLSEVKMNENVLPKVVAPGEIIGRLSSSASKRYNINPDAVVVGGTTDSNAAFIAAVASKGGVPTYGTAVTSLGSTLAIKMLSRSYVESSTQGVYSHRFPVFGKKRSENKDDEEVGYLIGGASNVGCAILRQEKFSNDELNELSKDMDVTENSPLVYYPLTKKGERFPIADGSKEPILTPKPDTRSEYLKGILQGISFVEKQAFQVLGDLGADPKYPDVVWTCGGGSKNEKWIKMRQRILEGDVKNESTLKVMKANNVEAGFGASVLAASQFC